MCIFIIIYIISLVLDLNDIVNVIIIIDGVIIFIAIIIIIVIMVVGSDAEVLLYLQLF